jgi:hypothetical protein
MSRRKDKSAPRAPATPETAVYRPTDVSPEEAFQAIGRLRKEARDEIDRLIRFLDKTDDYVSRELEDSIDDNPRDGDDDEESLAGLTVDPLFAPLHGGMQWAGDREEDQDDEPSLGSVNPFETRSQDRWADGAGGLYSTEPDAEGEHDGREPEDEGGDGAKEDDEPSLGWTLEGRVGGFDDREECDHNRPELAAARQRWHHPPVRRGNLTMLDGSPIIGDIRSMPSNVIVLDSLAVLP